MCENIESEEEEFFSCESTDEEEEEKDIIKITFLQRNYKFNKQLYENIIKLPNQLRNKLYIYAMRQYWRNFISVTAKVPIWYKYAVYQQTLLFNARQNNIHFMHLPCNTLPENKQYIVGCQCHDCLFKLDKNIHTEENQKQYFNPFYFLNTTPKTDSKWNNTIEILNVSNNRIIFGYSVFNPDYDICEPLKYKIYGKPINFN